MYSSKRKRIVNTNSSTSSNHESFSDNITNIKSKKSTSKYKKYGLDFIGPPIDSSPRLDNDINSSGPKASSTSINVDTSDCSIIDKLNKVIDLINNPNNTILNIVDINNTLKNIKDSLSSPPNSNLNVNKINHNFFRLENLVNNQVLSSLSDLEQKFSSLNKFVKNKFAFNTLSENSSPSNSPSLVDFPSNNKKCPLDCLVIVEAPSPDEFIDVKNKLLCNSDIIHGRIKIDNFSSKLDKIYIHCNSPCSRDLVISFLKDEFSHLVIRSVLMKDSFISFGPLPSNTSHIDLINCITLNDNRLLGSKHDFKLHTSVRLDKNLKGFKLLVFKVPDSLAVSLLKSPFVNFGLSKVKVKSFTPFFICHFCSGLGHTEQNCFKKKNGLKPSCPNCSLEHPP